MGNLTPDQQWKELLRMMWKKEVSRHREFNSEVRHPPMQPEGIPGIQFRAA
jgi:hypothetical protein